VLTGCALSLLASGPGCCMQPSLMGIGIASLLGIYPTYPVTACPARYDNRLLPKMRTPVSPCHPRNLDVASLGQRASYEGEMGIVLVAGLTGSLVNHGNLHRSSRPQGKP